MAGNSIIGNIHQSGVLPPLHVRKKIRESDDWKQAVMDAFERIGVEQFHENMKFHNYYRMVDGKMSYQELSEVVPHLDNLQDLLNGVGIPTFLKHYDILGVIVNLLVGKYIDLQDKFHVTDTGEIATNEFIRYKTEELQNEIKQIIENEINIHLAESGMDPEGREFESPEEQQQFLQKLEEERKRLTPKDTEAESKKSFKTIGVQWGEGSLDHDRIRFNLLKYEKEEFKDKFLTGRCFREYKIGASSYYPVTWSPKNTFIPKEYETSRVQDGEYVGRIQIYTPAECLREYGHLMSANTQAELMGGNKSWKNFVGPNSLNSGFSAMDSIQSNFNTPTNVPFKNWEDYLFMTDLEDSLGYPLSTRTIFNPDGSETVRPSFIPRLSQFNPTNYSLYGRILNDNFIPRNDACQATEVYFRGYELWGYLTYETETGRVVTEEVTEDILEDFLKENEITQKYKEVLKKPDEIGAFELNTIIWTWRPVCYEGVKIQSPNLKKPLYLYCKPCEHQIKGEREFDIKLPVAGVVGKSQAIKIEPFQAKYNLCMNQIYNLLEKEIGTFFLMDIGMIPSEYAGWGTAQEALIELRNVAKNVGLMPVATAQNGSRPQSPFNQFTTYDISYTNQISNRIALAEFCQKKAYEVIGINPVAMAQAPKYTTDSGVQISNEVSFAQIAEIYEDFSSYNQGVLELQLSVAQYCQSNSKDVTLYYTKSDASISFLKKNDPNFPLRNIGLIPAIDGRKRKELEEFKEYLKRNNTLSSDVFELAKLFASDAMTEVIEISRIERENRQREEQEKYQRDMSLVQEQNKGAQELQANQLAKEEESKQKDRDTDIQVATIQALGRASDKQSNERGFDEINKQSELALKNENMTHDHEMDAKEFKRKEEEDSNRKELAWATLKQKAAELNFKKEQSRSQEYIATVNKN